MEIQNIILMGYFFILGAIFGSFLNMLVYRVHHGLNLFGRSFCDKSKEQLKPSDLIPIVSYVRYKGRCRDCGTKLPIIYPIIEVLMGLTAVISYLFVVNSLNLTEFSQLILPWLIVFSLIFINIYFGYYDYLYWEIDELSVRLALAYVVLLNIVNWVMRLNGSALPFFGDPLSHLLGGLVLAGIIAITFKLTKGGGMGEGDIYLFAITGLILGFQAGLIAFMLINVLGSIVGLIKAKKNGKLKGVKIQFGPFIALGTIIIFIFKEQLLSFFFLYPF